MIKNSFEHGWTWGDFPLWFWKNRVIFTIGWSGGRYIAATTRSFWNCWRTWRFKRPGLLEVPTSEHAFFEPLKIAYWLIGYYSELYCYTPSRLLGMIITIHCREAYEPTSIMRLDRGNCFQNIHVMLYIHVGPKSLASGESVGFLPGALCPLPWLTASIATHG